MTQTTRLLVRRIFPSRFSLALGSFAIACLLAPVALRSASDDAASRRAAAQAQFARAEMQRKALEGQAERQRSLKDYKQVVSAYRRVYLITPKAVEVPQALLYVGDYYAQMGQQFDRSYFDSAVEAYEFLLHEYPTTRLRESAELAIAAIQRNGLGQSNLAEESYKTFLTQHPRSARAEEARKALSEIQKSDKLDAAIITAPAAAPLATRTSVSVPDETQSAPSAAFHGDAPSGSQPADVDNKTSGLSHVRIWNADTYTRIVIDLGGQAKYQSARISNPDRIYFDIENAKLGSTLLRTPIDVPAGGYLKSMRVAQNRAQVVRVVLEVSQVKDYSVFELANPDRLIVDVFGPNAKVSKSLSASIPGASTTPGAVPAPASAVAANPATARMAHSSEKSSESANAFGPAPDQKLSTRETSASLLSASAKTANSAGAKLREVSATSDASPAYGPAETPLTSSKSASAALSARTLPRTTKATRVPGVPSDAARRDAATLGPAPLPELTHDGGSSLTRALGLKIGRIVIDAGHGGHDTGTIGPTGLMEKDVCLDVALRLGQLIHDRLPQAEVIYTREDDGFVSLERRTAIANEAHADLFISVHANSSKDSRASGIETYYLNFNASPEAMQVATRENALAQGSVHDLQDLVAKIARNEKIEESRDLAIDVQNALARRTSPSGVAERNRGVRKAPFVVLIGANMPSALAEISFLSNPMDEQWLKKPENRQRIAEGLYSGIESYLQSTNSISPRSSAHAAVAADHSPKVVSSGDRQ